MVLATGLVLGSLLVLLQVGVIPGVLTGDNTMGAVGVYVGAALVMGGGVGGWVVWTRIAKTRTKSVVLTQEGIRIAFRGGTTVILPWDDPEFHVKLQESSSSDETGSVRLEWSAAGKGQYVFVTREGGSRIRSEAAGRGLTVSSTTSGSPLGLVSTTEIARPAAPPYSM